MGTFGQGVSERGAINPKSILSNFLGYKKAINFVFELL